MASPGFCAVSTLPEVLSESAYPPAARGAATDIQAAEIPRIDVHAQICDKVAIRQRPEED